jgi:glycosyltransferase involved in cell wall biosynthesis
MKVYVSKKPVVGPWGGGNKFVNKLIEKLKEVNVDITFDLTKDVGVIFCFDPRPNKQGLWFLDYYNHKKELGTKIIQRVGDVGTHSKPRLTDLVKQSVQISDFIIFPSMWSKDIIGYKKSNFKIIHNAPLAIFHQNKKKNHKNFKTKKIVTHHWSTNKKKGFDYYKFLGDKIYSGDLKDTEFTYIGRYNTEFISKGIKLIEPMNENDLCKILPSFDIYLTASIEEAGANHVLEAMAVGLPIVYRNVGCSISEYCKNYGSGYTSKDTMVDELMSAGSRQYPEYTETIDTVIEEYVEMICKI